MESEIVMEGMRRERFPEEGSMSHSSLLELQEHSGSTDIHGLVGEMMEAIQSVGKFLIFRRTQRKECLNLVRRLKLLVPLLEEIKELVKPIPAATFNCLVDLKKSVLSARKLLKHCNNGSKIHLAFESEEVLNRFYALYDKLNKCLNDFPYLELGISEEVKEQVDLMRLQLIRAKRRTETEDIELAMDMMVVFSEHDDRNADIAILERLAKKLDLHTPADLNVETVAVKKLFKSKGLQNTESTHKIVHLLHKFKQIAGVEEDSVVNGPNSTTNFERCRSLPTPHEFLCPITLEIMTDPVIVSTGQTYERESITKWLDSNHRTCPKTGQTLSHLSLAPNFALRNLILQWCEKNNFELPRKNACAMSESSTTAVREEISTLVQNLSSLQLDPQRDAVTKIRMLSKENAGNRILIANCGGILPLIQLLACPNAKIQEHAVTALLNLSLDESNKRLIAREGSIPAIIEVLQNGTDEARENSAAALFSLSMLDENKAIIGCLNGILPLVNLLQTGTVRGKKDAATALFNLSLNHANKITAIKAGIIPALLHLLKDKNLHMIDEALSILLLFASHPQGRNEIGKLSFIEILVEITRDGTPKNKECATAVLHELCSYDSSFILAALQCGVYDYLLEIGRSGTNRAQRKANSLLQQMSKSEKVP